MSVHSKDVLARLHNHPLYKKAMKGTSAEERAHIESVVSAFVNQLSTSLTQVAAQPGAAEAMKSAASGKAPVSGSIG